MAKRAKLDEPKSAGKRTAAGRRPRKHLTKNDRLVRLLKADSGRDIAALSRNLGWLPHTTRAALTRLRKAGYAIEKLPPQETGRSRYRIAGEPAEPRQ